MLNFIHKISEEVADILQHDSFPSQIMPDYLQKAVRAYPLLGGKRLRPSLLAWSCGLFGGEIEKTFYYGSAVEVWHNWTLVHDDIIDEDVRRRGAMSCHCQLSEDAGIKFKLPDETKRKYGKDMAILCGDLQQNWAVNLVIKGQKKYQTSPALALEIINCMEELAGTALISGEALDVELAVKPIDAIDEAQVMRMIDLKTGALFSCAARIGAALALGTFQDERVERIGGFAVKMGEAFQLQDDLLGIFGNFNKLGKDIGSDLRERKPTIILLATLSRAEGADLDFIRGVINSRAISPGDLAQTKAIMQKCGSFDYVSEKIKTLSSEAQQILDTFPDNVYRAQLKELLNYLIEREA